MRLEPLAGAGSADSWPERLLELAEQWAHPQPANARERMRGELWVLLVGALEMKIRRHLDPIASLDPDIAYDLAVSRALDLALRFVRGEWSPSDYSPAQLQLYLSKIAKNVVIDDHRSRAGKMRNLEIHTQMPREGVAATAPDEFSVDRARLAEAIVECAAQLSVRARTIWFLRTFLDLPSRTIASHPEVDLKPTAVDMALHRGRRKLRECLTRKGFDAGSFGPGVFSACWERFRAPLAADPPEESP